MIEIKEEDIHAEDGDRSYGIDPILTIDIKDESKYEQLKQQILQDHEDAKECREYHYRERQAKKDRQIVKSLEHLQKVMLGWNKNETTDFFIRRIEEILDSKK